MNIRELWRKFQLVLLLTLGMLPVAPCILGLLAPELLDHSWMFAAVYGIFVTVSLFLPGKLRLLLGIAGTLLMLVPCVVLPSRDSWFIAATTAVIYSALLIWSMRIAGWETEEEMPMLWGLISLCAHLIAQLLVFLKFIHSYQVLLTVSFFAFAGLTMLSLNRQSLNLASGGRRGFSTSMRRKNVLLTLCMFGVALLVALIPSVWGLIRLIGSGISVLMQKLQELFAEEAEQTLATQMTEVTEETYEYAFGDIQARDPNPTVYKVMTVVVLAVVIPFGIVILYKVGKLLAGAVSRIVTSVLNTASAEAEEYEDEITDTRVDAQSETVRSKKKQKRSLTQRRNLPPGEQIRYHYRLLAKKHPEWHAADTARDNLAESAAELYEKARYSDHTITQQDAARFKNETKRQER